MFVFFLFCIITVLLSFDFVFKIFYLLLLEGGIHLNLGTRVEFVPTLYANSPGVKTNVQDLAGSYITTMMWYFDLRRLYPTLDICLSFQLKNLRYRYIWYGIQSPVSYRNGIAINIVALIWYNIFNDDCPVDELEWCFFSYL